MSRSEDWHGLMVGGPLDGETRAIRCKVYEVLHSDATRNLIGPGRYVRTPGTREYVWDEEWWLDRCRSFPEWWAWLRERGDLRADRTV